MGTRLLPWAGWQEWEEARSLLFSSAPNAAEFTRERLEGVARVSNRVLGTASSRAAPITDGGG
jgi:hypothetical protein